MRTVIEQAMWEIEEMKRLTDSLYQKAEEYRYLLERVKLSGNADALNTETFELPATVDFMEINGELARIDNERVRWADLTKRYKALFDVEIA